jgi:hypothetical protein
MTATETVELGGILEFFYLGQDTPQTAYVLNTQTPFRIYANTG